MKEKIVFSLLLIALVIVGIVIGITMTIRLQRPMTIIEQNGEGLTTISIDFLGQEWNYEMDKTGVQSVND